MTYNVTSFEQSREEFEVSDRFHVTIQVPRAFGPPRYSHQLLFNDVNFTVPILFGISNQAVPTINNIFRLTTTAQDQSVPNIVFSGGTYTSIRFNYFKSTSMHENASLSDGDGRFEVPLRISITGGTFKEAIRFSKSRMGRIEISGGVFEGPVVFEEGVYDGIVISGGDFRAGIFFGDRSPLPRERAIVAPPANSPIWTAKTGIFHALQIVHTQETKVVISDILVKSGIRLDLEKGRADISNTVSYGTSEFLNGRIIDQSGIYDSISVGTRTSVNKLQISFSKSSTNELRFYGLFPKECSIGLSAISVNRLTFDEFVNQGSGILDRIMFREDKRNITGMCDEPNSQKLDRFDYYSRLALAHVQGNAGMETYDPGIRTITESASTPRRSYFGINNSDLGKITFLRCAVTAMIDFHDSKLTEISLVGSNFPDNIDLPSRPQERLLMHQLKKVYESSGDTQLARRYKAAELRAYQGELAETDHLEEKIILGLNSASNLHGESAWRALWVTFLFGGVLWLLVSKLFFEFTTEPKRIWEVVSLSVPYFLEFLNPLHKLGLIKEYAKEVGGIEQTDDSFPIIALGNTIDGIWRVISAYLAYQFIAAFRKHGAK